MTPTWEKNYLFLFYFQLKLVCLTLNSNETRLLPLTHGSITASFSGASSTLATVSSRLRVRFALFILTIRWKSPTYYLFSKFVRVTFLSLGHTDPILCGDGWICLPPSVFANRSSWLTFAQVGFIGISFRAILPTRSYVGTLFHFHKLGYHNRG